MPSISTISSDNLALLFSTLPQLNAARAKTLPQAHFCASQRGKDSVRNGSVRITFIILVVATSLIFGSSGVTMAQTVSFADAIVGSTPKDFASALTGRGPNGRWEIVADPTASVGKALAQTSQDRTDYRFPLAIYAPSLPPDVEVTIRFKPTAGDVDQAGGVAVRLVDPNNYYIARANALEDNIRFYRVVDGNRQQLGSANVKVKSGEWRTLTLRAQGDRFTVSSDGTELFAVSDKTFPGPGKVALWTKSDSVTSFDRLEIKVLP
jgi:hypothetical protein